MEMTQLPLIALYNYDPSILDGLTAPEVSELDSSLQYIDNIDPLTTEELHALLLAEIGELTPFYTDPQLLRSMIEVWAKAQRPVWIRLWQTSLFKYNPIWNKDGVFTEEVDRSGNNSGSSSTQYGRTDAHNVTGYDTNSYSPDTQDVAGGTDRGNSSGNYTDKEKRTRTEQGNIGVTTTQQMIREERDIAGFTVYSRIIEDFKHRFMVMLY